MKTILKLFLIIALLVSTSGCVSYRVIQTARGDPNTQLGIYDRSLPHGDPHPTYYAFLLVSVPFDTATLPLQAIGYGLFALWLSQAGNMH